MKTSKESCFSDSYTHAKEKRLAAFMTAYAAWLARLARQTVLIIDGSAGPGKYMGTRGTLNGSPIIIERALAKYGIPAIHIVVENKFATYELLLHHMSKLWRPERIIIPIKGDRRVPLKDMLAYRQGQALVYYDPDQMSVPFDLLAKHITRREIDSLFHFSANTIKRQAGPGKWPPLVASVAPLLKKKRYWFLTEPVGSHQWVFFYGTDVKKPSIFEAIEKAGFRSLKSAEGTAWFEKITTVHRPVSGKPAKRRRVSA